MRHLIPQSDFACFVVAIVVGVIGIALVVLGWRWDRARGRLRCPRCWYDRAARPAGPCPECGRTARDERSLRRTRRSWRLAAVGALLVIYAVALAVTPDIREHGWAHRLPTWVLVRLWPWADRADGERRIGTETRPLFIELLGRASTMAPSHRSELAARCLADLRGPTTPLDRRDAFVLLELLGPGVIDPATALDLCRREDDPRARRNAWHLVARVGAHDPVVRTAIIEHVLNTDEDAIGVIRRLPTAGEHALAYVPLLIELIRTGEGSVPAEAAWRLMVIGPAARSHLDEIEAAVVSRANHGERIWLAGAVSCVRGDCPDDAHYFAGLLEHRDPTIRFAAAFMLASGEMQANAHAAAVVERLIAALERLGPDDAEGYRERLVEALRQRGARAARAIPRLERLAAQPGLKETEVAHIRHSIDSIRNDR